MGNSSEKKTIQFDSVSNLIRFFPLLLCLTWYATVQVSKVFKVQTYYKTLINHESRCLNSWQEAVQEQRDSAKSAVWNRTGKCCSLPVLYNNIYSVTAESKNYLFEFTSGSDSNRFSLENRFFPSLVPMLNKSIMTSLAWQTTQTIQQFKTKTVSQFYTRTTRDHTYCHLEKNPLNVCYV